MKWHNFGPQCDVRTTGIRFYHWNFFRYTADGVHTMGLLVCLAVLLRGRSQAEGISFKTQLLFLLVYTFRYINLFICRQFLYLVVFKVAFWSVTLAIVVLLLRSHARRDRRDTCPVHFLIVPTVLATVLLTSYESVVEALWILSQHLESFAMLPQYIYCYRDARGRPGHPRGMVLMYVLSLGGYRSLYGLSWLYKYFFGYVDVSSWLASVFNLAFFLDFLAFRFCGASMLANAAMAVDDGLREATVVAQGLVFRGALPGELQTDCPQLIAASVVRVGRPEVELHTFAADEDGSSNFISTG